MIFYINGSLKPKLFQDFSTAAYGKSKGQCSSQPLQTNPPGKCRYNPYSQAALGIAPPCLKYNFGKFE